MKFPTRLVALGHVGYPTPPAFPFFFDPSDEFDRAVKAGRVKNLRRYGNAGGGSENNGVIGLSYKLVFPSSMNSVGLWSGSSELASYADRFRGGNGQQGAPCIAYTDNRANINVTLTGPQIGANEAFAIRGYLFEPLKGQTNPNWQIERGNLQFRVNDGQGEIRLSPTDEWQSLSLRGGGGEGFYNSPWTLLFVPEDMGRLHVFFQNGEEEIIDHAKIQSTREAGTLWEAGPVVIKSTGGAFFFQLGYPEFQSPGTQETAPQNKGYFEDALGNLSTNVFAHKPAGTDATLEKQDIDSVLFKIVATLTTSNKRKTPWFYFGHAHTRAGARNGVYTVKWDSNDHLDIHGVGPIRDIRPSFEGTYRRVQFEVRIRDVRGGSLTGIDGDFRYEALENRIVNLTLAGRPLLTRGIVWKAELQEMASATPNQVRSAVTTPETEIVLTICDLWALLDEDLMQDDPVLDGLTLGAALRIVLGNFGETPADLAGISINDGPRLPRAALDEEPAVRPSFETPRGEFVRYLMEKYGVGWELVLDADGVWKLRRKTRQIKSLSFVLNVETNSTITLPIEFSTHAARNNNSSYPGRFYASRIDMSRDATEFFNVFRVEGKGGIAQEWVVQESVRATGGAGSTRYLGRIKRYPTVRDDAWRTSDHLALALRGIVESKTLPPRYHAISTYYIYNLYPGDIVTLDGVWCRVASVLDGSTYEDTMQLLLQEI